MIISPKVSDIVDDVFVILLRLIFSNDIELLEPVVVSFVSILSSKSSINFNSDSEPKIFKSLTVFLTLFIMFNVVPSLKANLLFMSFTLEPILNCPWFTVIFIVSAIRLELFKVKVPSFTSKTIEPLPVNLVYSPNSPAVPTRVTVPLLVIPFLTAIFEKSVIKFAPVPIETCP